mmetsp:Transcript_57697/g.79204  ORF Transcript_57697/g.79204 Transcript_57697/m.79204 type:complete len:127 (-) Transcript_57697:389-769(-)
MGDLGLVVQTGKKTQKNLGTFFGGAKTKKELTFSHVFDTFMKIAKMSGNSSVADKENTIIKILQDASNDEAKYIVRWLQKNLKTGAAEKTVIAALARAIAYTPPNKPSVLNQKQKIGEAKFTELTA